jgi:hypothetical protein
MKPGSNDQPSWTFSLVRTTVRVKPAVLLNLTGLWAAMTWLVGRRRPEWSRGMRGLAGLLDMAVLAAADFGHALAHIISARAAGAPVDEILISAGMPRTLYWSDEVAPRVHRTRAVGGPIYSAIGLLTSALLWRLAPRDSLVGEVAGWSSVGHGFILSGSLMPLPIVDGGTLLKWTLVERGYAEPEAEAVVRKAALALGIGAATAGIVAARRRRWFHSLAFFAVALAGLGGSVEEVR